MKPDRWIAISIALLLWALPALALADHHEAGGVAEEHRSDKAAEKSNAQWDEDNDGRPEKVRGDDDDAVDRDDRAEKDAKAKKDEKEKKGKKDEKGKKGKEEAGDEGDDENEHD